MHPIIATCLSIMALCVAAATGLSVFFFFHLPLIGSIAAGVLVGLAFLSVICTMEGA